MELVPLIIILVGEPKLDKVLYIMIKFATLTAELNLIAEKFLIGTSRLRDLTFFVVAGRNLYV